MENSWKMEEFTAQEIHKKKEDKKIEKDNNKQNKRNLK